MRNRAKITQISKLESGDIQRFLCIGVTRIQNVYQFRGVWQDQWRRGSSAEKDAGCAFQRMDCLEPLSSGWWGWLEGDAHWLYSWDTKISPGGGKHWWINEYRKSIQGKHGKDSRIKSSVLNNCCDVKKCLKPWGWSPASCLNICQF